MAGRTAGLVAAALLVAALLGACRSGGTDADPDHPRPGGEARPGPTATGPGAAAPRARSRVERIVLTASDLGAGWRAQGNPATATAADGLAVLHGCLADAPGGTGPLAAARSADLLQLGGDSERTVVTSAAILDPGDASRLFTRMAGETFATCVIEELAADLTDAAGADRTTETQPGPVRPYPGPGVEAVRTQAVVSVSDPETSARFDAFVHVVALHEGDAVALLVAQSLFTDLPEDQLAAMARRLAGRMT